MSRLISGPKSLLDDHENVFSKKIALTTSKRDQIVEQIRGTAGLGNVNQNDFLKFLISPHYRDTEKDLAIGNTHLHFRFTLTAGVQFWLKRTQAPKQLFIPLQSGFPTDLFFKAATASSRPRCGCLSLTPGAAEPPEHRTFSRPASSPRRALAACTRSSDDPRRSRAAQAPSARR